MQTGTVTRLLTYAAENTSDFRVFTLLVDGESQEAHLTIGELDRWARQIAAYLQRRGLQGERVLLVFPFSLDFYAAMLGCLYAGAVGVLSFPPRPDRPLTPLQDMAQDAGAKAALTTGAFMKMLSPALQAYPTLEGLEWAAADELRAAEDPSTWVDPELTGDAPALLSYTSGSTSSPRGVLLTHRNLAANGNSMVNAFGLQPGDTAMFCFPLHHIGGVILPILGIIGRLHIVLTPTHLVLERPARWLEAVSKYHAAMTGAFNFLFQMSLSISAKERDALDLRGLRLVFVGGERIDSGLLDRFAAYFAPVGFRKETISPSYGLTESASVATLSIGLVRAGFQPALLQQGQAAAALADSDHAELVGCGAALHGRLVIVDPQSLAVLPENQVGEVWVQGPHVAQGYWQRPEKTAETFEARLNTGEGPFLRTGDLGFLFEGNLYITGRMKEVIILNGKNYAAPDFEMAVAGAHPIFAPGGTAAVGLLAGGEERLAILQEVLPGTSETDMEEGAAKIREKIAAAFETPVYAVAFVEQGKLPRTVTGKLQRYRCIEGFQNGSLKSLKISMVNHAAPVQEAAGPKNISAIESALLGIWMGVLRKTDIGLQDNFFSLGGNSLQVAQVVAHVRDVFQIELPMQMFFEAPTVTTLASRIEKWRGRVGED